MAETDSIPFYPKCLARSRSRPLLVVDDSLWRRLDALLCCAVLVVALCVGAGILKPQSASSYAKTITPPAPKLVRVGVLPARLCWPDPRECR